MSRADLVLDALAPASRGAELGRHPKAVGQPELPGDLPDRLAKAPRAIDDQIIRLRVRAQNSQHDRDKHKSGHRCRLSDMNPRKQTCA